MRKAATILFAVVSIAADKRTPEDPAALWNQIRDHAANHLAQLPNYTCREVIERLQRRGNGWNPLDKLEIEVMFAGRQELFAPKGAARFEEQPIERLTPPGTIGSGTFGSNLDAIFSQDTADFRYAGLAKKDGHQTFRYDFRVRLERSRFLVRHDHNESIVPYQGTVWVDAATLDLVRVDLHAKQIPVHLGVHEIDQSMHYEVMQIGSSDFLLPRKSELMATDKSGTDSLNLVRLESCREFRGDSKVRYGAPVEESTGRDRPDR